MFNVTILKKKDILRILIEIVVTVSIIMVISKSLQQKKEENKIIEGVKNGISSISENSFLSCIKQVIPSMKNLEKENNNVEYANTAIEKKDILQDILKEEISSIEGIEQLEQMQKNTNEEDKTNEEKNEETNKVEIAQENLPTQVITNNPISESYNTQYEKVKIKNETHYTLTEDMLKPDITVDNKNIILFHTHSCESYTPSEKYPYTATGTYRTTDLNFSVTAVGTELENQLKQYGYNVIHNTDYHDYPAYNGSYTRSLATVENILQTNQADIIMDVHRDAIGSRSDYAPTVKIGDVDEAAQIMFVIRNK